MDDSSPNLTNLKIDMFITWLKDEKIRLERQEQKFIYVDVEKIQSKRAKKRLFYYVDFRVSEKSRNYITDTINSFSIKENKSFRVDNKTIGLCVNKSSSIDFRLIFERILILN